jgi:methyl-accepting chemotaxis protein
MSSNIGILVIVFYSMVVIPVLTSAYELIGYALAAAVPSALVFNIIRFAVIKKQLLRVQDYLNGKDVSGAELLALLMRFPLVQAFWGLIIWSIVGVIAVFAVLIPSHGYFAYTDMGLLWFGIFLASCIVWVFQFYSFRTILAPLAQQIVKKDPSIFESAMREIPRFPLRESMLASVAILILVSFLFAILAGYRQAAFNLQTWLGKNFLDEVESIAVSLNGLDFSNPGDVEVARSSLASQPSHETRVLYLIDSSQPGMDLLSGKKSELSPVIVRTIEDTTAKTASKSYYGFDVFNSAILSFKEVSASKTGDRERRIFLVASYPWNKYSMQLHRLIVYSIILFIIFGGLASTVAVTVARSLSNPLVGLTEATKRVARGELKQEINYISNDELGELALSFRQMSENLKLIIQRINGASESLDEAMTGIEQASKKVNEGARVQEQSVEEVFTSMMEMNTAIQGISDNVETLSQAAQESSSSIFQVATSMKKIFESIETLDKSINDTSSSINEMIAAIDQVADNVGNLSAVADQTASSMSQMDQAIRQIEELANQTAGISETVTRDAEEGVDAVNQTREGIRQISEVVSHAEQVISKLGKRALEIGKIVQVIDEVTSQTNLLALNAAIIAAQAGEHGRGFAVVADEIKQLAERAAGSTREITQLIRAVQKESAEAVTAVQAGTRSVAEGVRLSDQAHMALDKILASSRSSTERVKEIARTTVEQAGSSNQISKAMEQVADMVTQISVATTQQSKGGALIIKATEQMKESSRLVHRTTEEQMEGARLIGKSIENITDMLSNINSAQKEQRKAAEQVVRLMERIRQISQESVESGARLDQVLRRLEEEAGRLRQEVSHFQT